MLSKKRKPRWTEAQKSFLREHAGNLKDEELAKKLGKTLKAVREMRSRMDIKKKQGRGIVALADKKSAI